MNNEYRRRVLMPNDVRKTMSTTAASVAVSTTTTTTVVSLKLLPGSQEDKDHEGAWEEMRPTVEAAGLGLLAITGNYRKLQIRGFYTHPCPP